MAEIVKQDQIVVATANEPIDSMVPEMHKEDEAMELQHAMEGVEQEVQPTKGNEHRTESEGRRVEGDEVIILSSRGEKRQLQSGTGEAGEQGSIAEQGVKDVMAEVSSTNEPDLKRKRVEQGHLVLRMQEVIFFSFFVCGFFVRTTL